MSRLLCFYRRRATMLHRFNLDGRSYNVSPARRRSARLTPPASYVMSRVANGYWVPLRPIGAAHRVRAAPLNRFPQLTRSRFRAWRHARWTGASGARGCVRQCLPAGSHVDYTVESRQLAPRSRQFLPALAWRILLFSGVRRPSSLVPRSAVVLAARCSGPVRPRPLHVP